MELNKIIHEDETQKQIKQQLQLDSYHQALYAPAFTFKFSLTCNNSGQLNKSQN